MLLDVLALACVFFICILERINEFLMSEFQSNLDLQACTYLVCSSFTIGAFQVLLNILIINLKPVIQPI